MFLFIILEPDAQNIYRLTLLSPFVLFKIQLQMYKMLSHAYNNFDFQLNHKLNNDISALLGIAG
jgi:hypothetical protein